MSKVRIFLIVSVVLWLPYGLWCFVAPQFLAEAATVEATSPTGTTELRAMYGGLQAAFGALALAALLRPELERPALVTYLFVGGGLFFARLPAAVFTGDWSSYTISALVFELVLVVFSARLLAATAPAPA